MNVWDAQLMAGAEFTLSLPDGHTAMLITLSGQVTVNGTEQAGDAEMVLLAQEGKDATIQVHRETALLVLTGQPIDEQVVGQGPFVMNTEAEIRQAVVDFRSGRFGRIAA